MKTNKCLITIGIMAILMAFSTQASQINRPSKFPTIPGQPHVDMLAYESSLVRMVSPVPVSTFVEVLKIHSDPILNDFKSAHKEALIGRSVMLGDSYDVRAQKAYNLLLQDYFPMNEADSAAARYLFSIQECSLKRSEKMPTDLTACQYHGAMILADIVKRLVPIHSLITTGSVEPVTNAKKIVTMTNPPELKLQIDRIVALLGSDEIAAHLLKVEPSLSVVWNSIRSPSFKFY